MSWTASAARSQARAPRKATGPASVGSGVKVTVRPSLVARVRGTKDGNVHFFHAVGPDDVAEEVLVAAPAQAVAAGALLVADAAGQVVEGGDLVEDDRPVGDRRADDPAAVLAEQVDEDLEVGAGQEARALQDWPVPPPGGRSDHHVRTCSAAKRSSSWTRVALSRRDTATRTRG